MVKARRLNGTSHVRGLTGDGSKSSEPVTLRPPRLSSFARLELGPRALVQPPLPLLFVNPLCKESISYLETYTIVRLGIIVELQRINEL